MNSIFCSLPNRFHLAVNFVVLIFEPLVPGPSWNPSPYVQFHYNTVFSTVKPRVLKSDESFVNTYYGKSREINM